MDSELSTVLHPYPRARSAARASESFYKSAYEKAAECWTMLARIDALTCEVAFSAAKGEAEEDWGRKKWR